MKQISEFLNEITDDFNKNLYLEALIKTNTAINIYGNATELLLYKAKLLQLQDSNKYGTLQDVRDIFNELLERDSQNIQIHLEAFAFWFYVMDDRIISKGILERCEFLIGKSNILYNEFRRDFLGE